MSDFEAEIQGRVAAMEKSEDLRDASARFMLETARARYSYNFSWLGRPIIQYPQDIVAIQELIWRIEPDLIVETGVAHGGSLMLSASMLALLDLRDGTTLGEGASPRPPRRRVLGIDIDVRPHNLTAIREHFLAPYIRLLIGSSTSPEIVATVREHCSTARKVLVLLDSNHTHEHVLSELNLYAPLVTPGSYCVVFDTVVEDLPKELFLDRPWGPGNNPKTAVAAFLATNAHFHVDTDLESRLQITVAPRGYLRRER